MIVLKRSRKGPFEGDIFAYKIRGLPYGYGRVIRTATTIGGWDGVILIYIYRVFSKQKTRIPKIDKSNLLLAPEGIGRSPWTRGYFETIENRPLQPEDVLSTHCFRDFNNDFRDEWGNKLKRKVKPCGTFGVGSFKTIAVQISLELGIRPARDCLPKKDQHLSTAEMIRQYREAKARDWES